MRRRLLLALLGLSLLAAGVRALVVRGGPERGGRGDDGVGGQRQPPPTGSYGRPTGPAAPE